MQRLEQTARAICALDLSMARVAQVEIPRMVDRFWPVIANEARDRVPVIGQWPFTVEEIAKLSEEYHAIIGNPRKDVDLWSRLDPQAPPTAIIHKLTPICWPPSLQRGKPPGNLRRR